MPLTTEEWSKAQRLVRDRGILSVARGMEPEQLALFLECLSLLEKCVKHIREQIEDDTNPAL